MSVMDEMNACLVTTPEICKDMEKMTITEADHVFVKNDMMNQIYERDDPPEEKKECKQEVKKPTAMGSYIEQTPHITRRPVYPYSPSSLDVQGDADALAIAALIEEDLKAIDNPGYDYLTDTYTDPDLSLRPSILKNTTTTTTTTDALKPLAVHKMNTLIEISPILHRDQATVIKILDAILEKMPDLDIFDLKISVEKWGAVYRMRLKIAGTFVFKQVLLDDISWSFKKDLNVTFTHPFPQSDEYRILSVGIFAKASDPLDRIENEIISTAWMQDKAKALSSLTLVPITTKVPRTSTKDIHTIINKKMMYPLSDSLFDMIVSPFTEENKKAYGPILSAIRVERDNDNEYIVELDLKSCILTLDDLNAIVDNCRHTWETSFRIVLDEKVTTTLRIYTKYIKKRNGITSSQIKTIVDNAVPVENLRTQIIAIIAATVNENEVCIHRLDITYDKARCIYSVAMDLDHTIPVNSEKEMSIMTVFNENFAIMFQHVFPKNKNIHRINMGLTYRQYIM